MNLLIDAGNSRLKWAMTTTGGPASVWHASDGMTYDGDLTTALSTSWGMLARPRRVVIASVTAPSRTQEIMTWVERHWQLSVHEVKAQAALLGIKNGYTDPTQLGSDRWAALIGARHLVSGATCVIDCGTALTIDALAASGEFLGGIIFPGLRSAQRCLEERAYGVGRIEDSAMSVKLDKNYIGRSTAEGVAAGAFLGLLGAIERTIQEYQIVLGQDMKILLTGGDAAVLMPSLRYPVMLAPDLTLQGLAQIAEQLP